MRFIRSVKGHLKLSSLGRSQYQVKMYEGAEGEKLLAKSMTGPSQELLARRSSPSQELLARSLTPGHEFLVRRSLPRVSTHVIYSDEE